MLILPFTTRKKPRIRVPPVPPTVALTDRATGALWYLKYNPNTAALTLVSTVAPWEQKWAWTFGQFDGPYLGLGVRLYVSNGSLSVDQNPTNSTNDIPPIARSTANDNVWYSITLSTSYNPAKAPQMSDIVLTNVSPT